MFALMYCSPQPYACLPKPAVRLLEHVLPAGGVSCADRRHPLLPATAAARGAPADACRNLRRGRIPSVGAVDTVLLVDVYILGCPPRRRAILNGLLVAMGVREARASPVAP